MFGSLGAPELLIILAIVVVLFGATRIGDIGKGIGRGIREFRSELKDNGEGKRVKRAKRRSPRARPSPPQLPLPRRPPATTPSPRLSPTSLERSAHTPAKPAGVFHFLRDDASAPRSMKNMRNRKTIVRPPETNAGHQINPIKKKIASAPVIPIPETTTMRAKTTPSGTWRTRISAPSSSRSSS
ncbi:MAG: twin-arginine translocase TatA/TatE family subunit [Chloroflexi bacterium]|nr:twin-arginine translocase TatA/TatE family subunit [Chloroflexota bacterium]